MPAVHCKSSLGLLAASALTVFLISLSAVGYLEAQLEMPELSAVADATEATKTSDPAEPQAGKIGNAGFGCITAGYRGCVPQGPLTVWQTSRRPPALHLIEHNRRYFPPGTEFRWLADAEVTQMVHDIAPVLANEGVAVGACEAFHMLRPMAFRTDLWRAMTLWMYGGLYMDDKMVVVAPIEPWLNLTDDALVFPMDRAKPAKELRFGRRSVWNGLLYSRPRHPVWGPIIRHIIENVECREYYETLIWANLAISGPTAFLRGWEELPQEVKRQTRRDLEVTGLETDVKQWGTLNVTYSSSLSLVGTKIPLLIQDTSTRTFASPTNPEHYSFHYLNKSVYCDVPGLPCQESFPGMTEVCDVRWEQAAGFQASDSAKARAGGSACDSGLNAPLVYILGGPMSGVGDLAIDLGTSGLGLFTAQCNALLKFLAEKGKKHDGVATSADSWNWNSLREEWRRMLPTCPSKTFSNKEEETSFGNASASHSSRIGGCGFVEGLSLAPLAAGWGFQEPAIFNKLPSAPELLKNFYLSLSRSLRFVVMLREPLAQMRAAWRRFNSLDTAAGLGVESKTATGSDSRSGGSDALAKTLPSLYSSQLPLIHKDSFTEDLKWNLDMWRRNRTTALMWGCCMQGWQLHQFLGSGDFAATQFMFVPYLFYRRVRRSGLAAILAQFLEVDHVLLRPLREFSEPLECPTLQHEIPPVPWMKFRSRIEEDIGMLDRVLLDASHDGATLPFFQPDGRGTIEDIQMWLRLFW